MRDTIKQGLGVAFEEFGSNIWDVYKYCSRRTIQRYQTIVVLQDLVNQQMFQRFIDTRA